MLLSDVCQTLFVCRLSVAYIGPKSRIERPRKTKIGTEVAHVTRDSDTTFKVERSRSPGRFTHRRVGASGSCRRGRGNVLAVRNCCYVAVCSAARGASAPTGRGEGRGHIVAAARLQLVGFVLQVVSDITTTMATATGSHGTEILTTRLRGL